MSIPTPGPEENTRSAAENPRPPAGQSLPESPTRAASAADIRTESGPAETGRRGGRLRVREGKAEARQDAADASWKSTDDWGVFRAVVVAVGVVIAAIGGYYLVTGTAGVAQTGGGPVNASLESQFRFFSAMMVGVGAAFVAIAIKFQWANMLWLVCLMVFLGGIGRVLSWAFSGTPHFTLIILMIVELAFPPALLVWHRFIVKTSELRREIHQGPRTGSTGSGAGA
ncbi:DUF4345 domain-containing protein [Arthrobacter gandavensis]|uniref:DUF4345 domain-containing protein n=1 Tax=Arthrobacter gandavensis TaxID=169960 RepID=UPI00188E2F01|nr:DUF4345 domain-containing protein [Arthrobacter gandavensis]MBF4992836.1 DUF4345 domain-containing protein [Arthrobacter gandavensis]